MHLELCICDAMTPVTMTTQLVVVAHYREVRKVTNTGWLAHRLVTGSELRLWGARDDPDWADGGASLVAPGHDNVVLTAAEGAEVVEPTAFTRPVRLIVPDGSWRQANKMPRRIPALKDLTWLRLPPGPPSRYQLRRETRDGGLATIEAIARALRYLGEPAAADVLDRAFAATVRSVLASRGTPSLT